MSDLAVRAAFYTQRADAALVADVLRITGSTESFATSFMGRVEDDKDPACTRLIALKNTKTGHWEIKRQTRLGIENGMTRQQTETSIGLCFFDALHYLARFQMTEAELGKQPCDIPGEGFTHIRHYTDAAKEAGQPIDAEGEVHPCINGQILTDGFFDDAAMNVAATTKGKNLPALRTEQSAASLVATLNEGLIRDRGEKSSPEDLVARFNTNRKQIIARWDRADLYWNVIERADKFDETFNDAVRNSFEIYDLANDIKFGLLTLGIHSAVLYAAGNVKNAPVHSVEKALNGMNTAIAALPEGPEKSVMQDFARAAAYAIPMERAAFVYHRHWFKKPDKVLKQGVSLIAEAAAVLELGETDRECLKADYLAGKIESRKLQEKIRNSWGSDGRPSGLKSRLQSYGSAIRCGRD